MAVIKVFSSQGIKTVEMMGNVSEQDFDPIEEEDESELPDFQTED